MRRLLVLVGIAVVAAATTTVLLASRDHASKPLAKLKAPANQPVAVRVKPVKATCATRSYAGFGPAFSDPRNLVVGPLAMVGAADFTTPSTVRRVRGNKFPLLVKNGHTVTLEVAESARGFSALGYGPLPQGETTLEVAHPSVTFVACGRGEPSGSTAGGPVTFWSGGLAANEPHCVPLDVYVDGAARPSHVFVELGMRCKQAA